MITITFIINGIDAPISVTERTLLRTAKGRAIVATNNTGRPAVEWEVHDDEGAALDENKAVKTLGIVDGDRVFLTLRTGAGGNV